MFNYCRILDPRLPIGKKINEYIVFIVIYKVQELQDESNHGSFCLPWPHIAATDGAHEDDLVLKVPLVSIWR